MAVQTFKTKHCVVQTERDQFNSWAESLKSLLYSQTLGISANCGFPSFVHCYFMGANSDFPAFL